MNIKYCGAPECTGDNDCLWVNVCMCGSDCDKHGMYDGHSPVSMHYYYLRYTEPEE